ncbi:MAG: hypothetical protein WAO98_08535 [Alphaproteobacteria bacterium]
MGNSHRDFIVNGRPMVSSFVQTSARFDDIGFARVANDLATSHAGVLSRSCTLCQRPTSEHGAGGSRWCPVEGLDKA